MIIPFDIQYALTSYTHFVQESILPPGSPGASEEITLPKHVSGPKVIGKILPSEEGS